MSFHVQQPAEFVPDFARQVYEPRVLWSVAAVDSATQLGRPLVLPRTHFKNASRFPVRLTHLLMSPINYVMRDIAPDLGVEPAAATYDCSGSILQKCRVRISAPLTYPWSSIVDTDTLGYAAEPTADPSMEGTLNSQSSGLIGTSRWDFEYPFVMPAKGALQFDISSLSAANGLDDEGIFPETSMLWEEGAGNQFGGYARVRERAQTSLATTDASKPKLFYPSTAQPLPLDRWTNTTVGFGGMWPSSQMFNGDAFRKQIASRGMTRVGIRGFAVHIDQLDYDDEAASVAAYGAGPVTPMAARMACRARALAGGTGEWWWREGAPIALVCPTLSPALVRKLEEPIWLGPNESLEVELTTPAPAAIVWDGGEPVAISPQYNVGVSLAGQAIVEMG